MGVRPQTRGTAMNPVDHPHGGGEGSTTPGRHPVTPWGVPTLGYRTRKKNKASDRYIVRGRRRGKGQEAMSRSSKKGPWVEERLIARIEAMNAGNKKQMVKTWSRDVHDLPGDGRPHDRRARRAQARARVRDRVDGRPQAGRVRADAPYRGHAGSGREMAMADDAKDEAPGAEDAEGEEAERAPPPQAAPRGEADAAEAEGRGGRGRRAPTPRSEAESAEAEASRAARTRPPGRGRRGGGAEAPRRGRTTKPAQPRAGRARRAPIVRAHAQYVRTSARKARLVCDHIRGKSVDEARAILDFTPRAAARDWSKLLESAVANAEHNHELVGDELRVKDASTPTRADPQALPPARDGPRHADPQAHRHLTITLTPKD